MNLWTRTRGGRIKNGDDIPEWLLTEVLIRLPSAKYVFRFKLVSKQWLSVISTPSFVRAYISRANEQPWTLVSHLMIQYPHIPDRFVLRDLYRKPRLTYYVLPLPSIRQQPDDETYRIHGVSNGLLLYHSQTRRSNVYRFYICNLVTGQWTILPPSPCVVGESCSSRCSGFLTRVAEDGTCVLKSYRVVIFKKFARDDQFIRFEVFFSEIHEWKVFNISCDKELGLSLLLATTLNGILHWVATGGHGIIAYDPYHTPERMRVIAFAKDIQTQRRGFYVCLCAASQGKLRYFQVSNKDSNGSRIGPDSFQLWTLDDYNSGDWCLQHKISFNEVLDDTKLSFLAYRIEPVAFHPLDSDVVYLGYYDCLMTYNIKTRKLAIDQVKCATGYPSFKIPAWPITFLLMTPPWPLSVP